MSAEIQLCLLAALQLSPLFYLYKVKRVDFLSIVLLGQFLAFTLHRFYAWFVNGIRPGTQSVAALEIQTLLLLSIVCVGVYYGIKFYSKSWPRHESSLLEIGSPGKLVLLTCFTLSILFVEVYPSAFKQVLLVMHTCALLALYGEVATPHSRLLLFCRIVCGLSVVFYFVKFGSLGLGVTLVTLWFLILVLSRKPNYIAPIATMLLLMVVLQSIKSDFRESTTAQNVESLSQRSIVAGNLAKKKLQTSSSQTKAHVATSVLRIGDNSLEFVLRDSPQKVSFWRGESYLDLLYFPIPRLLWSEKPARVIWNKFGRKYSYLSHNDVQTSVRFNHYAEAYMNWGWGALFLSSLVFPVFLILMERICLLFPASVRGFCFIVLVMPMAFVQDTTSMVASSALTVLVLLLLFKSSSISFVGLPLGRGRKEGFLS